MAKFRKKPVVVEAIQFTGENLGDVYDFMRTDSQYRRPLLAIQTLEGEMRAYPGDWIIRGVKNELYPCKPDIFEATYEPAGD